MDRPRAAGAGPMSCAGKWDGNVRGTLGLRLRWSWRDLRSRWVLVAALAFIIALGTGAYAGLGGTSDWRIRSNDASYAALRMHDLKVTLPDGVFVPDGRLVAAVRAIPSASTVAASEERLVVSTQVDASTGERTVLVPGELVGMPAAAQAASVDSMHVVGGRGLRLSDATQATVVLESKFAADHHLAPTGQLVLSANRRVSYVGTGYTPEYFRVVGRSGQLLGESGFAVLFMPLTAAQVTSGHPGMVNDLVLRLAAGANRAEVQRELASSVSSLGAEVTSRDDDPVYTGLYADARNDQQTWNAFALLILLGAGFAAFNLVTRLIDAQRREIGVGMALGVSPRSLAMRPLIVGVQVAVGGVLAGVAVGWLLSRAMRTLMMDLLPLPIWLTPFPTGRFLQAAGLGLLIPIAATVLPLRRVLRLQPVDAIRTGAYGGGAGSGRLTTLLRRLRLPGRTYRTMPLRNVLRAPRRTVLTALGVAAAVTSLVAVLGMLDSFSATGDRSTAELERMNANRLTVSLSTFLPTNSAQARAITTTSGVVAVEPELRVPTRISANGHDLETVTEILDLQNKVWTPSLTSGDPAQAGRGILLSQKAAADLHVRVGDTVQLRHPVRSGLGFRLVTTPIVVSGLHPNPLRPFSYLDADRAGEFGLSGLTNVLTVVPGKDTSQTTLTRALFSQPGVASVEPATGFAALLDKRLGELSGVLRVIELVTLLLALLIAFNTASLSADERAREYATMFAFGLRTRAVTLMAIAENAVIGLAGTLVGAGLGFIALRWMLSGLGDVMPDLSISATLSAQTWSTTLVLGVLVVALAPLLNTRKLRQMDIPATLRVVE